ncbi:MAG: cytochrome b N-terminal domain-containing protein, partial [Desulfurivibrionaceae bacterium]|nr:cytochrome b N-terminal domain-containing protein [Desulfurivibrionaceae bacterium]
RSLHFYSSQLFFLFLVVHTVAVVVERGLSQSAGGADSAEKGRNGGEDWLKLTLSLPVVVLLLFTGYILRGDATGRFAGIIAENIVVSIPVLGGWLNAALFNISAAAMKVVYANHLIGLGVLWGYLVWQHLRKYRVSWQNHGLVTATVLVAGLILAAPIDPILPGGFHVSGPWFFVGQQEMLRIFHPLWAGVVFPVFGMLLLYHIVKGGPKFRLAMVGGALWASIYAIFTLIGFLR